MTRISPPGAGWHVEVTLPTGEIVRPSVVGGPSRNPKANDFPSLEIPVRDRDLWRELDLTKNVGMDVYYDGQPQPIDGLEAVQDGEGATVTLVGRGGTELESRDPRSIDYEPAHSVAETIIKENTSYQANVDRPNTTVDENVTVQSADTDNEFGDRRDNFAPTSPVEVENDLANNSDGEGVRLAQTANIVEAETVDREDQDGETVVSDPEASDGTAIELDNSGEWLTQSWGAEYYVPESDIRLAVRYRLPDDPDSDGQFEAPEIEYQWDGDDNQVVGGFDADGASTTDTYTWDIINVPDDMIDGDQSFLYWQIECQSNPQNGTYRADVMCIFDARWHDGSQFDNFVDSNGYLSTPTEYPIGATKNNYPVVEFRNTQSSRATVGGRAELTPNDASAIEEIALSNDRGQTYATSGPGVTSFETDFSDVGPSLRLRVALSGTDATRTTATPTQGFERGELDAYTLKADLEDLPLVVDWAPDDSAMSNLQYIAETVADFIFEYRVDSAGTESVEMTVPGQRTADRDDPISGFDVKETSTPVVERVVVKGTSRRVEGESWTANIGAWVGLDEDDILLGRSSVTDPSTDNTFSEGTDYRIDPEQGRVKALDAGQLTDGTSYEIDYSHTPSGQDTVSGAGSDPETEVVRVPALVSDRACEQAAQRILSQVDSPLQEATVTIPNDQTGWNIADAVTFDPLPAGFDDLEIREVTNTPEQTVLRLGSRDRIGGTVERISRQVKDVSRRA